MKNCLGYEMSYIQSLSSGDLFEELYHRSPVPKNLLFSGHTFNPAKQITQPACAGQKSQIFHSLKDKSLLSASKSPLPINISRSFLNGSTHNLSQLVNDLTAPKKTHSEVLTNKSELNNTFNTTQSTFNTSQSAASLFNKIKLLSPNNESISQIQSKEVTESDEEQENLKPNKGNNSQRNRHAADKYIVAEPNYPHHTLDTDQPLQRNGDQEHINTEVASTDNEKAEKETTNYELYNWIIKPLPGIKAVCVEGKKHPDDDQFYHSSQVVTRVKKNVVGTANGSRYVLMGNIETLDALEAGITEELAKSFHSGFPIKWKMCLKNYFSKVQFLDEDEDEDLVNESDQDDVTQSTDHATSKNEESNKFEKKKTRKKTRYSARGTSGKFISKSKKDELTHNTGDQNSDPKHSQEMATKNKEYILTDWIIKPIRDTEEVCVEGKKGGPDSDEFWHSTAIQYIKDKRTLVTNSGSIYRLQGKISSLDMLEAGFSKDMVKAFSNGFPKHWKTYVTRHFADLRRLSNKDSVLTSKVQTTKQKFASSTACTPSGVAIQLDGIRKTRSGRVSKPALAWWAGQRVKTYSDGTFEVLYNSPGASEIMKTMTVPYSTLPKVYQNFMNSSTLVMTNGCDSESSVVENHKKPKTKRKSSEKRKSDSNAGPNAKVMKKNNSKKEKQHSKSETKSQEFTDKNTVKIAITQSSGVDSVSDIDSLVEDLKSTVGNSKSRKQRDKKRETCYSKIASSEKKEPKAYDAYSVDLDSDLDDDEPVKGKRSRSKSKKGRGTEKSLSHGKSKDTKTKTMNVEKRSSIELRDRGKTPINYFTQGSEDSSSENYVKPNKDRLKKVNGKKASVQTQKKRKSDELSEICSESSDEENMIRNTDTVKKSNRKASLETKEGKNPADLTESPEECSDGNNVNKITHTRKLRKRKAIVQSHRSNNIQSSDESMDEDAEYYVGKSSESLKRIKGPTPKNKKMQSPAESSDEDCVDKDRNTRNKSNKKTSENSKNKKSDKLMQSSDESTDDNDFSKKTGTVKAKRTQSRIPKPASKEQDKDLPWSKQEISSLNKAVASIPGDDPNFWDLVSEKVKTRTGEQCVEQYYKDDPKPNKKKSNKINAKSSQVTAITAGKGTLKRKQQIRELIEQQNEGYEDDLFESTPYRKQGSIKIPKLMDDEEEDIFDEMAKKHPHLLNKIYTPLTRVHLEPMSEKKTPASTLESPFTNIDRKEAEQYIHQLQKRRHMKGRKILDKSKTPVNKKNKKKSASPMKNLFGKASDQQGLFMNDDGSDENHEDSETEQDYYWSGSENE